MQSGRTGFYPEMNVPVKTGPVAGLDSESEKEFLLRSGGKFHNFIDK